jgi:dinuclear metal center YbgI/SA1388 family protein
MAVQLQKIIRLMESFAPLSLAESWDNPGLLVGNPDNNVRKVLITLDVTMECVDYAVRNDFNLIISHHPVIFNKLASLRTDQYDGKLFQKLLSHGIAVYSAHTNWDSAAGGVNDILAQQLGLTDIKGLVPVKQEGMYKLVVFVPESHGEAMCQALGEAGAGIIGRYSHCMFSAAGEGRFRPLSGAHPYIGSIGNTEHPAEIRIETTVPEHRLDLVISALKVAHPYEEPAYDIYPLARAEGCQYSLGRIGTLPVAEPARLVLRKIKRLLGIQILSYAGDEDTVVEKIALCSGAGAEFISKAKQAGAQLYLTGDVRYHDAQQAVKEGLVIADGGHYGTEILSMPVLMKRLSSAAAERGWTISWCMDPTSQDVFCHC